MILQMNKLLTGPWFLKDLDKVEKNGLKVFSCFHCGGGSTMGYKLAGYEVLGGVEIDPEMMNVYRANHNPKHSFLMGVQEFNKLPREKIPDELFDLDILDGSPPCSSFSMAGSREKAWGEKKKFREGQAHQVLDDLFFEFIKIADILKPKVVVAENVKGLIQGNAKGYVKMIADQFDAAGYDLQLFLLNAAFMGVPQKRERTFFIARRKDLKLPKIKMEFNEKVVAVKDVSKDIETIGRLLNTDLQRKYWKETPAGKGIGVAGGFNSQKKISPNEPCFTQTASQKHWHWKEQAEISNELVIRLQAFPDDFKFHDTDVHYFCGMSVPPFMMQRVANQIAHQWFGKKELLNG